MKSNVKKLIIFGVIVVGIVLVYAIFFSGKKASNDSALVSDFTGIEGNIADLSEEARLARAQSDELLILLRNLEGLSLSSGLFSHPAFRTLEDISITLIPEGNEGRTNPFAPIGTEGSAATAINRNVPPPPAPVAENSAPPVSDTTSEPPLSEQVTPTPITP